MKNYIMAIAVAAAALLGNPFESDACTRVVYKGLDGIQVIARSLDWKTPIPTNIYVYPRGMKKQGASSVEKGINWVSKHGAVYAVGYDAGVTEGMNECGLVVNGLFCKGTVYNSPETSDRPLISMAMFVPWLLDNCATADECVDLLKDQNFTIESSTFDGGTTSALHWGITDASGKTVIVEFQEGHIHIYDPGERLALTNDPNWPQMDAIIAYWEKIGGKNMLPGTVSSPDRCVRANYFAHHVRSVEDPALAVGIARSVLVNACVPYTYMIESEPNLSSTQWRSYSSIGDRRYYFELVTNPGYYYVDLQKIDLMPGAPVLRLDTSAASDLVGDANHRLKRSAPFTPAYK